MSSAFDDMQARVGRWLEGRWPHRTPPPRDDAENARRRAWTARLWISFVIIVVLAVQATSVWLYAVLFTYALTVLVTSRAMLVEDKEKTASSLHLVLEIVMLTVALGVLDALQSPLVGLYSVLILIGGLIGGRRTALSSGVFALLAYGGGLVIAERHEVSDILRIANGQETQTRLPEIGRSLLLGGALMAAMVFAASTFIEQARLRAQRAERLYRSLFNTTHEPIVIWQLQTTEILDVNPAAVELAGRSRKELIGIQGVSLLPPPDQALARLLAEAYPNLGQTFHRFVRPDGEERMLASSPVVLDNPRVGVSVIKDLTDAIHRVEERQRYAENLENEVEIRTQDLERSNRELARANREQQRLHQKLISRTQDLERVNQKLRDTHLRLVEAQRLRVVEDLAGAVAHTVNNPLQALLGTVELAIEDSKGGNRTLERIRSLAKRIQRVVESTLELVRRGQMDLKREHPGEILSALHDECTTRASRQGVRVTKSIEPKLPSISVDRSLILSALTSITENALEALGNSGEIHLEVTHVPEVDAVRFRISDTGPGLPEKIQEKVLEPFFTTKGGGTGLGLAIANGVVLGHQGNLTVANRAEGGASISVELPCDSTSSPDWRAVPPADACAPPARPPAAIPGCPSDQ